MTGPGVSLKFLIKSVLLLCSTYARKLFAGYSDKILICIGSCFNTLQVYILYIYICNVYNNNGVDYCVCLC